MKANGLLSMLFVICIRAPCIAQSDVETNGAMVKYTQTSEYATSVLSSMLAHTKSISVRTARTLHWRQIRKPGYWDLSPSS
jgi:hypothetical protein